MAEPNYNNQVLNAAQEHIREFFDKNIPAEYVYHDLTHTLNVVAEVREISSRSEVTEKEAELLELAAWFHDTGYDKGPENHEKRGAEYATAFLAKYNYSTEDLATIKRLIMATQVVYHPQDLLEGIISDADLSHLGKKTYWDRCGRVRQELLMTRSLLMSEQEWVDFELSFMNEHRYFTFVAEQMYNKRKLKHIKQLRKQKLRLNPKEITSVDDLARRDKTKDKIKVKKKKKKKKKTKISSEVITKKDSALKELNLGRGVETMFRTTYKTHINLSSMADSKANIMLSINAIIISIVLPQLVPNFEETPKLIIPTIILLLVCLVAMVYATLSTRPKITEGKFTREDIEEKRSNLLFFGNFYSMKMEDYHWGMTEMIKDSDFLYSSMTRDLYWLGIVLAKKYRYLSRCYQVFMYGMIVSVAAFAVAFLLF